MSTIASTSAPSLSLIAYAPPVAPSRRVYDTLAERMRSATTSVRRHVQRRGYVLAAAVGHLGTDPDGVWGAEVMTSALTDQQDGSVTLGLEHLLLGESTPSSRQRLTYLLLRVEAALIGQRPGAGYESTARTLALSGVVPHARAASGRVWDAAITAAISDECGQPADIGPDDWTLLVAYLDAARAYVSDTADSADVRALAMTCFGIAHMLRAVIDGADSEDADIVGIARAIVVTMDWCSRVHLLLSPGGIPGELWERGATRWIRVLSDAMDDRWRQSQAHSIPSPIVVAGMLARGEFDRAVEHVDVDDPELPYRWIRSSDLRDDDTAERVYCFPQVSAEQRSALLECGWIEATAEMIQHSLDVRAAASAAEQIEREERKRMEAEAEERLAAQVAAHPMTALAARIVEMAEGSWIHPMGCGTSAERAVADAFYSAISTCRVRLRYQVLCYLRGQRGLDGISPTDTIDGAIENLRTGSSGIADTECGQSAIELLDALIELRAMLDRSPPLVAPATSRVERW